MWPSCHVATKLKSQFWQIFNYKIIQIGDVLKMLKEVEENEKVEMNFYN